jgi:hypothetical protein
MIGDEFGCGGPSLWWLFPLKMVGTTEMNQGKMEMGHGGSPEIGLSNVLFSIWIDLILMEISMLSLCTSGDT